MAQLIKFEVSQTPKLYLTGVLKRFNMESTMGNDNPLPGFWKECLEKGVMGKLEEHKSAFFDNSTAGVMLDWERGDGNFSYVIGAFLTEDIEVPEGFSKIPFEPCKIAIGYIKGKEGTDIYANAHKLTEEKLKAEGLTAEKMPWCAEIYNCPRFTEADSDGNVILDYYIPVEG